jgi:predicted dehydrogenase
MANLRIGIVGAGIMGRWHAGVYKDHPQCQLVAVCDFDQQRAQALRDEFGMAHVFRTHQEMLEGAPLDVVSVCTPDFAHAEATIDCALAGVHVLVEKPLAVKVNDAEAIIASAQKTGVKVMAQFSHRWVPAYRQTKDLIASGQHGEPLMAYARKSDPIYVPTEMLGWAARSTPAWFLSSHDIDLVCWYFDSDPVEVFASAVRKVLVGMGIDTPDAIMSQVRFANGAIATFEACWTYPNTWPTMPDSFVEVITTTSVIHMDRKREQIELSSPQGFQYPRNLLTYRFEYGEMHGAVPLSIRHFIRCVLQDEQPTVSLESSLRVTRILDAIQRSIETNAPVTL